MSEDLVTTHRRLLFRIAYDLLGSVTDAEDVVQETWLRWDAADRSDVREPRAYLVRITTTLALNRLRDLRRRRESYIGPWLPEPLIEPDPGEEVDERLAREQEVSLAMLVVLETLSPAERAVFVLREVFGMSHEEVASTLDRSPAAVRQMAHRAREHVQARQPRFSAGLEEQRKVTALFLQACATGDLATLMELLAPDVTLVSDGGGRVKAARRPILGPEKVARFLLGIAGEASEFGLELALVNGDLGMVGRRADGAPTVGLLEMADGKVTCVYLLANPEKLAHV